MFYNVDVDDPLTFSFMKGLFRKKPPCRGAPLPTWDLTDLLKYLKSDVFEPLDKVPWERLIQKTLALILLASGRRLKEIASLTRYSYPKNGRVFLRWPKSFLAKNEKLTFTAQEPSISAIEVPDKSLCPVRALSIFMVERSKVKYHVNDKCLWPKSQKALATLLISLVKESITFAGKPVTMKIGPHQFRKLAASLCYNFFPMDKRKKLLPTRMGSAALRVLRRAYIRQLRRPGLACVAPLGTVSPTG